MRHKYFGYLKPKKSYLKLIIFVVIVLVLQGILVNAYLQYIAKQINEARAESVEASVSHKTTTDSVYLSWSEVLDPQSEIEAYIRSQALEHGIDPEIAVYIAKCESSLNPNAKHLISSATGIYQFTKPTWEWIKAEGERTDYKASTREFMKWFPVYTGWWENCLP